jgi:TRAP-type C4-dicarboxylate transport system permease small subunit
VKDKPGLSRLARRLVGALILIPVACAGLIRWFGYHDAHSSSIDPEVPGEAFFWLYFFAPVCGLCLLFIAIIVWRDLRKTDEPTALHLPPYD